MKTRAAVIYDTNMKFEPDKKPWKVVELEIDKLGPDDVLVHLPYSGVCHTDLHLLTGDLPVAHLPMIGGHEGSGVVEDIGTNVTAATPGDHVILTQVPRCGVCRNCLRGRSVLCDLIGVVALGQQADGNYRYSDASGNRVAQWAALGTFAEYVVVNRTSIAVIDARMPFDRACLIGCAVTTGFGAATEQAQVHVGDTVVVWGCGGVGLSAVQGAVMQGAAEVIAIDTNDMKLDMAREFGATTTLNPLRDRSPNPNRDETAEVVLEHTGWEGVDSTILTVDYVTPELIGAAYATIRRGGRLVLVGTTHPRYTSMQVAPIDLTFSEKSIIGSVAGSGNPVLDLPRNVDLYLKGRLKLDEMISNRYPIEDVNQAFEDLLDGKNIKSVLTF